MSRFLTVEEVKNLIDFFHVPQDKALVSFLYLFGTGVGELYNLKKEDFNIEDNKLWVKIEKKKRLRKTNEFINVKRNLYCYLNDPFTSYITNFIRDIDYGIYLFRYGTTDKISHSNFYGMLKRADPTLTPGMFRYTRNVLLINKGFTPSQIIAWNGRRYKFDIKPTQNL